LTIADIIAERGPVTVAAFMDLALYDPALGYYARAPRRSGRAGDFFTSVDVGPLFGELLALQVVEMAGLLAANDTRACNWGTSPSSEPSLTGTPGGAFDLVEVGAGDGRLSADILRAACARHPAFEGRVRLHLVDASREARGAHADTLGYLASHLASSSATLPASFEGVLLANELLDALPVHQVVMRAHGLREVYVEAHDGRLQTTEGAPSTPALADYLTRLGVELESGWCAEINLRAVDWTRNAAHRLRRGFIVLIDYGHEARHLYSASHASGTLTTFTRHTMAGPEGERRRRSPPWLDHAGEHDITAHVDFTSVRAAAEAEGLVTLGFLDQTYFVLGLVDDVLIEGQDTAVDPKRSRALKTLMMPGGMGSTHKVLILGKGVGTPKLKGCSFGQRVT
jgi:SAM-dependent MidA family methyltransferase